MDNTIPGLNTSSTEDVIKNQIIKPVAPKTLTKEDFYHRLQKAENSGDFGDMDRNGIAVELLKSAKDKGYKISGYNIDEEINRLSPKKEDSFLDSITYTAYDDPSDSNTALEAQRKYWSNVLGGAYNILPGIAKIGTGIVEGVSTDVGQRIGNLFGIVSDEDIKKYDDKKNKATGNMLGGLMKHYSDTYGSVEGFEKELMKDPTGIVSDLLTVAGLGFAGKAKLTNRSIKALEEEKANTIAKVKETTSLEDKAKLINEGIQKAKDISKKKESLKVEQDLAKTSFKYDPYVAVPVGAFQGGVKAGSLAAKGLGAARNKLFPVKSLDNLILEVSQGNSKDNTAFKKALGHIDVNGVKSYTDLKNGFNNKITAIADKQNELLSKDEVFNIDNLITTKGKRSTNFVKAALDDMESIATKHNDLEMLDLVDNYRDKEFLSEKDLNDLARYYGSTFKNKSFGKTGEALGSVNAIRYENVRKGLKNKVRELTPDNVIKDLDSEMSNLYKAKDLAEKMEKRVEDLVKKFSNRNIFQKAAGGAADVIDLLSLGTVKSFISRLMPRGHGEKLMNAFDLEQALNKRLKVIDELIEKADNLSDIEIYRKVKKVLALPERSSAFKEKTSIKIPPKINRPKQPGTTGDIKDIAEAHDMIVKAIDDAGLDVNALKDIKGAIKDFDLPKREKLLSEIDDLISKINDLSKEMQIPTMKPNEIMIEKYGPDLVKAFNKIKGVEKRVKTKKGGDNLTKIELQNTPGYKAFSNAAQEFAERTGQHVQEIFEEMMEMFSQLIDQYADKIGARLKLMGEGTGKSLDDFEIKSTDVDINNPKQVNNLYKSYKNTNTDNGIVIDTDEIKKMFSDFDPKKPELVHRQSSDLSQKFYEKTLAENPSKKVVLIAGGGGSGKSEVLIKDIKAGEPAIVFDGTGKNYDKMIKNYELAKKAGKDPQIDAVYIDYNIAKKFNNMRDRTVPEDLLAGTHKGYRKTMLKIAEERPDIPLSMKINFGVKINDKVIQHVIPKDRLIEFLKVRQELE